MQLWSYFRSSAAYRVRIALNLKNLAADIISVDLLAQAKAAPAAAWPAANPQRLVPVLVDGDITLTQSLAIMEYLEEMAPMPPLLPADAVGRARVRALALCVACDIHPLGNLRVLNYLRQNLAQDEAAVQRWAQHWIQAGLSAMEQLLAQSAATGEFCHGATPGLADCCLIPQVFNARRFNCSLEAYPQIVRIDARCRELPAFRLAAPSAQADFR